MMSAAVSTEMPLSNLADVSTRKQFVKALTLLSQVRDREEKLYFFANITSSHATLATSLDSP